MNEWSAYNIVFTTYPIKELEKKGFYFNPKTIESPEGVYHFTMPMQNTFLEWIEVVDENSFLKDKKIKTHDQLSPAIQLVNVDSRLQTLPHPNGVDRLVGFVFSTLPTLEKPTSEIHFFQLDEKDRLAINWSQRKDFPIWAAVLHCQNLSLFIEKAQPDEIVFFQGKKSALIKQYITCWDLLVIDSSKVESPRK